MQPDRKDKTSQSKMIAGVVGVAVFVVLFLGFGFNLFWAFIFGAMSGAAVTVYLTLKATAPNAPASEASAPEVAAAPASAAVPAPEPEAAPAAKPVAEAEPEAASVVADGDTSPIKPSKALPGQAELAARKGSWRYEPGA